MFLKPFENDFLFKPTRIDAEVIPKVINPKIRSKIKIANTIPIPTVTKIKINILTTKIKIYHIVVLL